MSDRTSPLYDGTMERTADGGVIRFERRLDYAIRDLMEKIKKDPMGFAAAPPIRPRPLVPIK